MGEKNNTTNSPYFDGWENYIDSQHQENAPSRDEYFGLNQSDEEQKEPGAFQQIVGGGINIANNFLEENLKDPIEKALEDTVFRVEKGASGGGEGKGKPARDGFHNFKNDPICVQNCIIQCPFGMTFCKMDPTPVVRPAKVEGLMANQMLTIYDHWAYTNVFPYNLFTLCQNPFNPYVIWATALATAAKGGVFTFTPWLCTGSVPLFSYVQPFWKPMQGTVMTNGQLALTQSSTIACWWPAQLSIVHPGQGLDASWGKAMFLGPGGLAGIQNIVNMAGSLFSIAGGFTPEGVSTFLNKGSAVFDLLDGSINLMSGDIVGALFSGASGFLGLGGDDLAINRGIKKIADLTADLFNHGIKKLEIADVRRSVRNLGDDMSPQTRRQFNDACDRAENMNAQHPQHNTDGSVTPANTPHGDTISVSSNHPRTSGGQTGRDNWSAKYRNEADVPSVKKRREAREAYRKHENAKKELKNNPPVSQKEKDKLAELERQKKAKSDNLKDHPEPQKTKMNKAKEKYEASKHELETKAKPAEPDYETLKAKKKAMDDAEAKMNANRVTPEEKQHLDKLENDYNDTMKKYANDISMANNEADIKAWKEFEAEKARIAEKERLFKEGQKELADAIPEYNRAKSSVNKAEKAQQEYKDLQDKVKTDKKNYLKEKERYDQKMAEHEKAKAESEKANTAYEKEKLRLEEKQLRHDEAVDYAQRTGADADLLVLGEEQDKLSGIYEGINSTASKPAKDAIKDGINSWAEKAGPDKEEEKPDIPPIDTSWIGYDFTLDY